MRAIIAAGGTAGHINPALAIADKIMSVFPESQILFIGSPNGMEAKLVKKAGYDFAPMKIAGFQRKLSLTNIKRNVQAAHYYINAKPAAKKIITEFKPDICIGTGGYVCAPVLKVAVKLGIKTVTHESNSYPGITTKMLSDQVDKVLVGSADCIKYLKDEKRCVVTGNPLRNNIPIEEKNAARERLGLVDGFTILSFGGSLGANRINDAVAELIKWEEKVGGINHIHAFGGNGKETFLKKLEDGGVDTKASRLMLKEYIDNMYTCMCAADLIISRAGSMTLTETIAIGRASILVPYPYATENHQYYNAKTLADANAAILIEDKELTGAWLIETVNKLNNNRARLELMSENCARLRTNDAQGEILSQIIDLLGVQKV